MTVDGRVFSVGDDKLFELTSSTVYCMSCHDGTVAENLIIRDTSLEDKSDPASNHPVNVAYPLTSTEFVPIELLDDELVLENGLVTCTTCHVLSSQEAQFPTPLTDGRLCSSCHLK